MTTPANLTFFRAITICCLLLLGLLAACKDDKTGLQSGDPTDFKDAVLINQYGITSITISAQNPIIKTGMTQQYTAQGNTASGGSVDISKDVHWTVSNSSAVRIDENGLLTGLAQSDVTVSAQLSTFSDTKSLRVTDASVSGITITETDGTTDFAIDACKTLQLKAEAVYTGETLTANVTNEVDWSTTSPTNVAHFSTVSGEKGWLLTSAVNSGISVDATLDSFTANVTVTTQDGFTSSTSAITLNPSNSYILASTSAAKQFSANATFDDNTSADITRAAIWSSDNAAIASVNNDDTGSKGLVSAHAVGSAAISAQCGATAQTASTSVTVNNSTLTSVTIKYDSNATQGTSAGGDLIYLNVGNTLQLDAFANYSNNTSQNVTNDASTSWEVYPDTTIVSVDSSGLATAKALGTTLLKVTYQGLDNKLTIIVQ